jgi:large repetitive protein
MLNNMRRPYRLRSSHSSASITSSSHESRIRRQRQPRIESLEPRYVLTGPTLAPLSNVTLLTGAPLEVPINATPPSGDTLTYSVTSTNGAISANLQNGNPDLVLNITHTASTQPGDISFSGTIVIELFPTAAPNTVAQIEKLVEGGAYNGIDFYRIVPGFVAQAGLNGASPPAGVTVKTLDDEFDPVLPLSDPSQPLRYSSAGVVGLARQTADDTGSSEFFITTTNTSSFLDYQYTVFGQVVSGSNILTDIGNVPNNASDNNLPYSPVKITSASITTDNNDFALGLSAPLGTTGTGTVTVTANDGHGDTTSQSFQVTVQADPNDPGPVLTAIPTVTTTVNTPVNFQLPAFDLEGDPITYYDQTGLQSNFGLSPTQPISSNLNVSVNSSTGLVTVTPTNGLVGVTPMFFGVASSATPDSAPNTQMVPLFIDPAAPTAVTLEASSDTGSSNSDGITSLNNSNSSHELQFLVTGVTSGDTVILMDGTQQIGSAVATSSSVVVTTNGTTLLTNGTQQITAEQVLENQSYTVGNASGTTSLASAQSSPLSITVDSTTLPFTSSPVNVAIANHPYNYTAQVSDIVTAGIVYTLVSGPTGFSINSSSGVVTWTPTAAQIGNNAVQIRATDTAGNTSIQAFNVAVSGGPPVVGVSTTAAANSKFVVGQSISILVNFAEAVNVTGTPLLALNDGGVASYVSGSGTSSLLFNYTVGSNQNIADLDYASTSALTLNGGTIADSSNTPAVLTLPATGTDGLAEANLTVGTPPVNIVDLAVALTASSSTLPGGSIVYTVTVTNNGPSAAQNVTLSDTLPTTTTFGVQRQTSGAAFTLSNSGNAVSDTIASLASGATASFTIMADIPVATAVATISDTASVSSTSTESNSANNTATASTTMTTTGVMLVTDPNVPTETDLVVAGTAGADNISFASAGAGKVSVTMDGKSYGTFAVTGRIVAYAGATGNDEIVVSSAITLPAFLYAGSGNDELVGGSGNNVLVGGGGADTLIGGTGHNILIAGTGPSKLYSTQLGVAASVNGGSILIAGSTSYDHNDSALSAIMAEWGSSDSYATRVAKISNGSLPGGVALNTSTIVASKAVDELFASTGYDWFWSLSPVDQILNLSPQKKASIQIN